MHPSFSRDSRSGLLWPARPCGARWRSELYWAGAARKMHPAARLSRQKSRSRGSFRPIGLPLYWPLMSAGRPSASYASGDHALSNSARAKARHCRPDQATSAPSAMQIAYAAARAADISTSGGIYRGGAGDEEMSGRGIPGPEHARDCSSGRSMTGPRTYPSNYVARLSLLGAGGAEMIRAPAGLDRSDGAPRADDGAGPALHVAPYFVFIGLGWQAA